MSYALGARTWERHIDIDYEGVAVAPYCSLPHQVDIWFKAYKKAYDMFGGSSLQRRVVSKTETEYLDALVRGVYLKRELEPGYVIGHESFHDDFYLAVPLQKGQLSSREVLNGLTITDKLAEGEALKIDSVDGPYAENATLRDLIQSRGL